MRLLKEGIAAFGNEVTYICIGKEPNLVKVPEPIVIVGDLHG